MSSGLYPAPAGVRFVIVFIRPLEYYNIVNKAVSARACFNAEKPPYQRASKGEMDVSVLDSITRRVTDTARAAAKISGSVVEVTRLNLSINAEEEKIKKLYTEIGKQLYEEYTEGKPVSGELLRKCVTIDEIIASIIEMKEKILELKNVKACPNCETVLDIEMEYCHKCGRKQEERSGEAEDGKDVQD
jgi:hypothetical protein